MGIGVTNLKAQPQTNRVRQRSHVANAVSKLCAQMAGQFSRVRESKGDTIVEVMISLVILSTVMATVYSMSSRSLHAGTEANQRTEALSYAQSQIDLLTNAKNSDPSFADNYESRNPTATYCIKSDGTKDTTAQSNSDKLCDNYNGSNYNIGISFKTQSSQSGEFIITAKWPTADAPGGISSLNLYYKLPGIYQKALVVAGGSSVSGTTVTMNGTVNPNGNVVDNCYFEYDTTVNYSQSSQVNCGTYPGSGTTGAPVSASISTTGLRQNTTYFFRLCAHNLAGLACSDNSGNFTTPDAPSVTTVQIGPADYGPPSATIRGIISGNGNPITDCHFDYGLTTNYGQTANSCGATSGNVQASIATSYGNTYHYRVVASNIVGTSRGADASFSIPWPPSVDYFYAQPSTVAYGSGTILYWGSSHTSGCYSTSLGWLAPSGSVSTGTLTITTNYQIACYTSDGVWTGNSSARVNVGNPPSITSFTASSVVYGGSSTLSWTSSGTSGCYSPTLGYVSTAGSWSSPALYSDTTYQIACYNSANVWTAYSFATARVTTGAPIITNFSASPSSIAYGATSTLSWASSNTSGCYSAAFGWVGPSGSWTTPALSSSTIYNLACYNSANVWTGTASLTVSVAGPPSVSYFNASPSSVIIGTSTNLYWSSTNTVGCLIPNVAWVGTSGSYTVTPSSTTTYQIACYNSASVWTGYANATVSVTVPPPPVINSFNISGSTGANIYYAYGVTRYLSWSTTGASSCNGGWYGNVGTAANNWSVAAYPGSSYVLTCYNIVNQATQSQININYSASYVQSWENAGSDRGQQQDFGMGTYYIGNNWGRRISLVRSNLGGGEVSFVNQNGVCITTGPGDWRDWPPGNWSGYLGDLDHNGQGYNDGISYIYVGLDCNQQ